jgi:hypothetical protein
MPRETIGTENYPGDHVNPIQVSWVGNGGFVGIGVEDPTSLFDWRMVRKLLPDPNVIPDSDGEQPMKGFWAQLNREDVNRLIRVLRKARDQTFGHDE